MTYILLLAVVGTVLVAVDAGALVGWLRRRWS
jgi:hypothetical protein